MKVVCDTNILVSGILLGGPPREIIRLASRGHVTNFVSAPILRELEAVLSRPKFRLSSEQVLAMLALVRETSDLVDPNTSLRVITDDPDDDRILEAALCVSAEYIVSGDKHLLDLKEWRNIRIVTAATFMHEIIGQHEGDATAHPKPEQQ